MIDDMVDIGLVLLRGCGHCMTYTKFLFYDTLLSCSSLRELIILYARGALTSVIWTVLYGLGSRMDGIDVHKLEVIYVRCSPGEER